MRVYLDASVLTALLTSDPFTVRADAFIRAAKPDMVLSDFARAEFCSVIARRVRTGEMIKTAAQKAFSTLDIWSVQFTAPVEASTADVRSAEQVLRRLDLTLRAPDALNIAITRRIGAHLATFDVKMMASARILGLDVAPI